MKKKHSLLFCALFTIFTGHAESTDYTKGLSIWFDSPNTLQGKEVWHSAQQDASWESQSLPIGNGSIGANILGSVEAERITFLMRKHSGVAALIQPKEQITIGM